MTGLNVYYKMQAVVDFCMHRLRVGGLMRVATLDWVKFATPFYMHDPISWLILNFSYLRY